MKSFYIQFVIEEKKFLFYKKRYQSEKCIVDRDTLRLLRRAFLLDTYILPLTDSIIFNKMSDGLEVCIKNLKSTGDGITYMIDSRKNLTEFGGILESFYVETHGLDQVPSKITIDKDDKVALYALITPIR